MTTVRKLQKLWADKAYERLWRELAAGRVEAGIDISQLSIPVAVAAMAIIRLDELNQHHVPLYTELVRFLIRYHDADGGWTEPMTTALALRALMSGNGNGLTIDHGIAYLAALQREDGLWPAIPLRRMPSDALVSAFVLAQLSEHEKFRAAIDVPAAELFFLPNEPNLDPLTARLWRSAAIRLRTRRAPAHLQLLPLFRHTTTAAA